MFYTAIIIGFVSSFHCIGMCGPLAMSLPMQQQTPIRQMMTVFQYHIGRIITYMLLGLAFGILGRHFFLAGYQQKLSISLGVAMLLFTIARNWLPAIPLPVIGNSFSKGIYRLIQIIWEKRTPFSTLLLGMANGLLPCGMVYFALAGALSMGDTVQAMGYMLLFGVGTFPLLIAIHQFGLVFITPTIRTNMRKFIPYAMMTVSVLLVLRGLNLGIPYLSPFLGKEMGATISCH